MQNLMYVRMFPCLCTHTLVDCDTLCKGVAEPYNSSCSWRGYEEQEELFKSYEVKEE